MVNHIGRRLWAEQSCILCQKGLVFLKVQDILFQPKAKVPSTLRSIKFHFSVKQKQIITEKSHLIWKSTRKKSKM